MGFARVNVSGECQEAFTNCMYSMATLWPLWSLTNLPVSFLPHTSTMMLWFLWYLSYTKSPTFIYYLQHRKNAPVLPAIEPCNKTFTNASLGDDSKPTTLGSPSSAHQITDLHWLTPYLPLGRTTNPLRQELANAANKDPCLHVSAQWYPLVAFCPTKSIWSNHQLSYI